MGDRAAFKSGPVDEADVRKIIREEVLANPAYKELIRQEMRPYLLIKKQEKWNRVAEDKFSKIPKQIEEKADQAFLKPGNLEIIQTEAEKAAKEALLNQENLKVIQTMADEAACTSIRTSPVIQSKIQAN